MTDEEYIMYKLDTINRNSTYGLVDAERLDRLTMEACNDLARIWNVGPGEVEKMVRDYIGAVTCDFKPLQTYPKPHIHIRPVKVKTLKERLEETKMNSTSTETFKDIIAVDRIFELERLKTPTIENFADEEPSSRRDILRCAEKCVCGKREQDYGTPESNFQLIADLWNGYLGGKTDNPVISVTSVDVSMMMALMKIARIRNGGGSGDSFVDLAGYAACGGEIWALKKETNGDSSQDTN